VTSPEVQPEPELVAPGSPGAHERHIARGALLQQFSQVWGTLCMLAVATVLGRHLSLDAFGVYGLLISLAAYLIIVQVSVEAAAVRVLSAAEADEEASRRSEVLSTTMAIYTVGGIASGLLVATGGVGLIGVLGIPESLHDDAREAVLVLALVTAVGWPFKTFQDALRGMQLFGAAALGEMAAYTVVAVGMVVLVLVVDAPLWVLIALGGSLPALTGLFCAVSARVFRVGVRFRRSDVSLPLAREMLGVSAYLFVAGLADIVIYSLDRVILAAFRGTAKVGLYEGAARPHNLIRQLHGTLLLTVVPVASRYIAEGDHARIRDLLLRGTRYVLAIVAPVTTVLIVLAAPLLEIWLGDRYRPAAFALAVLSSYWLIGANTGVIGSMLLAAGRVKFLARFAWAVAVANLVLSLILTPWLGLDGVVLGTTIPYVLFQPWFLWKGMRTFEISVRDFSREVWVPAYATCAAVAAVLIPVRLFAEPTNLLTLAVAAIGALAVGYAVLWLVFLTPGERRLVLSLIRSPLRAS
jgi:O-antigen/teichoic acid export membrane protein